MKSRLVGGHITPASLWFMILISIVLCVYKPTFNWGGTLYGCNGIIIDIVQRAIVCGSFNGPSMNCNMKA